MQPTRRQFQLQAAAGLALLGTTPAQGQAGTAATVVTPPLAEGPFKPQQWPADTDADLTTRRGQSGQALGTVILIQGRVLGPDGRPVAGARIELWQANAAGRYSHPADRVNRPLDPHFDGAARLVTDAQGNWSVRTVMPGPYQAAGGVRAPHIHFEANSGRTRLTTQMLFAGDSHNAADPLLRRFHAGGPQALAPLLARNIGTSADGIARYSWDLVLPRR
jgi:protocatechuate 3,4-dioxygenase beta subunit